jgi:hypothetical protein
MVSVHRLRLQVEGPQMTRVSIVFVSPLSTSENSSVAGSRLNFLEKFVDPDINNFIFSYLLGSLCSFLTPPSGLCFRDGGDRRGDILFVPSPAQFKSDPEQDPMERPLVQFMPHCRLGSVRMRSCSWYRRLDRIKVESVQKSYYAVSLSV